MNDQFQCAIDAATFGRVYHCVSKEETRYYLNGLNVEAGAEGALMVATDGHCMACALDRVGIVFGQGIVQLSAEMLKACRASKNSGAVLYVKGQRAMLAGPTDDRAAVLAAFDIAAADVLCLQMRETLVDGSFPDWRRAVPTDAAKCETLAPTTFSVAVLDRVQKALADPHSRTRLFRLYGQDANSPHLVVRPGGHDAFGVLMPVRDVGQAPTVGWTARRPSPEAVAAE